MKYKTMLMALLISSQVGASDFTSAFSSQVDSNIEVLSVDKMDQIKGEIAPLVAVGIMTGGRFIITRWVSQRAAISIARRGGSVLAKNRQQASAIAKTAGNGRKGIREFHPGSGARYSHWHTSSHGRAHVWYGKPR